MGDLPEKGWYADPDDSYQQRYWDGEEWGDRRSAAAPSTSTKPSANKVLGIIVGSFVAFIMVAVLIGFVTKDDKPNDSAAPTAPPPAPPTSVRPFTITPPAAAPQPTMMNPNIPCHEAPSNVVDIINFAFADAAETLINTTSVDGPKDMTYIAGDIAKGDKIVSHADVWLLQHGAVFALSGDARRRTLFADGRDFASAGDVYGSAAQDCIQR